MSFPRLLEVALAGTLRQAPPEMITDHESASAETRLLRGASYEGLRRLAGRPLETPDVAVRVEPAPLDAVPEIPPAAAVRLRELLEESRGGGTLDEWLSLAAERNLRVPALSIPDLLEYVRDEPDFELCELMAQVGGERLPWLARLNPDWRFAAYADPEQQLALGPPHERVNALRRIRRQDPTRGRTLVLDLWPSEPGYARPKLLDALAIGLSVEDEQFLEDAIKAPRKDVRAAALRLIRGIPNSRFGQRWAARTHRIISFRDAAIPGPRFEIREPIEVDPEWLTDGLDPRPRGTGMTAWLLQQLLALTPPSMWPPTVLGAIDHTDWPRPLLAGLAEAACAYGHAEWCEELIMRWASASNRRARQPFEPRELFLALDPPRAESALRRLMALSSELFVDLVRVGADHWSEDFSGFVVDHLLHYCAQNPGSITFFLGVAGWRLDPRVLPVATRLLDAPIEPAWARSLLDELVETLDYRLAMRKELDG